MKSKSKKRVVDFPIAERDDYEERFFARAAAFDKELDATIDRLADKHGLTVIYNKSEDSEAPYFNDCLTSDHGRTLQTADARMWKERDASPRRGRR